VTTSLMRTRTATLDDVPRVQALFERCSAPTLQRRFHVPVPRVPERLVRRLVLPTDGWSLVAEQGTELIAHGCAGPLDPRTVEIGLLVDDAFQRTGVGTRVVRDLAVSASSRGYQTMVCQVESDDEAVTATLVRAGLHGTAYRVDGGLEIHVPLAGAAVDLERPA